MDRMADNVLKHADVDSTAADQMRSDWRTRFLAEPDRMARMEIATKMAQLDQPATVRLLLELLAKEQDSGVRQQLALITGYLQSASGEMPALNEAFAANYRDCGSEEERLRLLSIEATLPGAHAVEFMRAAFTAPDATAQERAAAAAGLFQLQRAEVPVDAQVLQQVRAGLQQSARGAVSSDERLLAMRALAAPGQDHKAFFAELLKKETDADLRRFLELASQEYPTE
jgi:hypothetical protein